MAGVIWGLIVMRAFGCVECVEGGVRACGPVRERRQGGRVHNAPGGHAAPHHVAGGRLAAHDAYARLGRLEHRCAGGPVSMNARRLPAGWRLQAGSCRAGMHAHSHKRGDTAPPVHAAGGRACDAGDEAAAADGHEDRVQARQVREQLQRERALAARHLPQLRSGPRASPGEGDRSRGLWTSHVYRGTRRRRGVPWAGGGAVAWRACHHKLPAATGASM
jgi:hypothetical protein